MNTTITKKLVDNAALVTGGSRCIGATIVKRLTADGADLASVFVTNGGYSGMQQVVRLSTRLSPNCSGQRLVELKQLADEARSQSGDRRR